MTILDGDDERAVDQTRARERKIFVIEDDDDIRESIGVVMSYEGYVVRGFTNAADALAAIDGGARPDLIVLDLMMPRMDGWQFRLEQRRRPAVADVPVLIVSADGSSRAAAMDADAFMRKPLDFTRLRSIVTQLLTDAERRRLGAQLRESERLRALGTLVAGVAHEINNPLTFVSGSLELVDRGLRMLLDAQDPSKTHLDPQRIVKALADARAGTERIASIVRTLSRFARVEQEDFDVIDLHGVLDGAATLAAAAMHGRATLERRYGQIASVVGSEARLAQVFLNVLVNAAQAIPLGDEAHGVVGITTGSTESGTFVEIRDNGSGIPEDMLARIFEPFFTTKPPGEGTGLGLSISHDIVRAHGGRLSVTSMKGEGTTVRIELPQRASVGATVSVHEDRSPSGVRERPLPAALRSRVLVIDDEPAMCSLIARVLSAHEVVTATRAQDALAMIRGEDAEFDVVFCDLCMPGMDGSALYDEVLRTHRALASRFVFMTGAASTDKANRFLSGAGRPVLEKPFPIAALTRFVEVPLHRPAMDTPLRPVAFAT